MPKKILSVILLLLIMLAYMPFASVAEAATFSDMPNDWSTQALKSAVEKGLLNGFEDGTIRPTSLLTRAQMAAIVVRAFSYTEEGDISRYTDIKETDWHYSYIAKAFKMGVMHGDEGLMRPEDNITRQEAFAVLARALKLEPASTMNKTFVDSGDIADWAKGEVFAMVNAAYIQGSDGKLTPLANIRRNEFAQMMFNISDPPDQPTLYEAPDGPNVSLSIPNNTARIGLYYYHSSKRDTSLASANLENKVGGGYIFGYYDGNRVFHETARTSESRITMKPTGSGREVSVYISGSDNCIYKHTDSRYNLAVRPISASAKAETWFKGNTYYGDFEYYRYISERLTVINLVNTEDYIKGVVPIEMSTSWPREALKAQALCARTYFAKSIGNYSKYGFDITADTNCQAYWGTARANANSDAAVNETAGEYITYNGKLCTTFYFSSSGGGTESSENVFVEALPYCRGVMDPYEDAVPASMNSYKSWRYELTSAQIAAKLKSYGITNLASIIPVYSDTGNVIQLTCTDTNGNRATISKSNCNSVLGLPSIRYSITKSETNPDLYIFEGSGWGHSVGMSQFGAYALANYYGCNYRQIIAFYFQGVNISTGV